MSRRLVYYVAVTLDGFIARQDGSFDCFLSEGEHFADLFERYPETIPAHLRGRLGVAERANQFDTVLMGRHTYDVGVREGVTNPYTPLRQFVISKSMVQTPDPAVELYSGDPVALVRRLKQEAGMDVWLCGGAQLAGTLAGEIDELILKINPILIGAGIPLFQGWAGLLRCSPQKNRSYRNGFALRRYEVLRPAE
jgi:dihydrofolate reductase